MTATAATTAHVIDIRTTDTFGRQIVDLYEGDTFVRRISYRGTARQARAYALLQLTHDTDPAYDLLLAALRGEA